MILEVNATPEWRQSNGNHSPFAADATEYPWVPPVGEDVKSLAIRRCHHTAHVKDVTEDFAEDFSRKTSNGGDKPFMNDYESFDIRLFFTQFLRVSSNDATAKILDKLQL